MARPLAWLVAALVIVCLSDHGTAQVRPGRAGGVREPRIRSDVFAGMSQGWRQRRIRRGGNAGRLDSNGGKAPNATKYFYRTVRRCFFLATPKWSDPQCWHKKRVPGANDMVLITFPKEGGRRFFLIDVDRDINLRYLRIWDDEEGARGLKSIIFRRMSQSFDDLNVGRNGLIVGPSVAIYLMDNIRIKTAGDFNLLGLLMGNGVVRAHRFIAHPNSFIVPGSGLVRPCKVCRNWLPMRLRWPSKGAISIVQDSFARPALLAGFVVLKNTQPLPWELGGRPYDTLSVNSAANVPKTFLINGPPLRPVAEDMIGEDPTTTTFTTARWTLPPLPVKPLPPMPSSVLCLGNQPVKRASGLSKTCAAFLSAMLTPTEPVAPKAASLVARWETVRNTTTVEDSSVSQKAGLPYERALAVSGDNRFPGSPSTSNGDVTLGETSTVGGLVGGGNSGGAMPVNPCLNSGTPNALGLCVCPTGYAGATCADFVCPNNCGGAVRGQCTGPGACTCRVGFSGFACETAVCPANCNGRGTCSTGSGVPVCSCAPGWDGAQCKKAVPANTCPPCLNGGNCLAGSCACLPLFTGQSCQIPVCDCSNGGTCVAPTVVGAPSTCNCVEGRTGSRCETATCLPTTCANGATCANSADGPVCSCASGFTGAQCATPLARDAVSNSRFAIPFGAAIALIVVGCVIGGVLIVLLIVFLTKRGIAKRTRKINNEMKAKLVEETAMQ